jgi:hypothetical protein
MKKFITLSILILSSTFPQAQSALNCELGLPYIHVVKMLNDRSFVATVHDGENRVVARNENYVVTYYFHEGSLFKTDMVITYSNKKEAESTVESFRNYYTLARADVIDLDSDEDHPRFAALHGRQLHEIAQVIQNRKTIQVRQTKMDLDRCPGNDLQVVTDDKALFSMMYK